MPEGIPEQIRFPIKLNWSSSFVAVENDLEFHSPSPFGFA
jgi:hypothetical protein